MLTFTLTIHFKSGTTATLEVIQISNLCCDYEYLSFVTKDNQTFYINKNLIKRIEIQWTKQNYTETLWF